uniref:Interferon alpha-inducible protein 27, mitochondrial n=1 Tax=Anas platyrhynchos TaxID=8839 RepID=A0A8B9R1S0_ANAPL
MGWVSRAHGRGLPRAWAGHPARLQLGSGVLGNPSPATAEALHAFPLLPGDGASPTLCPTVPALCSDTPSPWDGTWHAGSRCVGVPPAGVALFGVPAAVSALGFKAGGIAAGSMAAKMMSVAAIANNGGVAAGSTVAVLQSVGAAGLSAGAKIGLSSALGTLGGIVGATKP